MSASELEQAYFEALHQNNFQPVSEQLAVIDKLQKLSSRLKNQPPPNRLQRKLMKYGFCFHTQEKGIYIYGSIGSGKTFIMDLFYEHLTSATKMRLHFYRFMEQIHELLKQNKNQSNPLQNVARHFTERTKVLCIDEFDITNIADAMIMYKLLKYLFRNGIILITTSNSHPDELYKGGLQYKRFVPAIDLIKKYNSSIALDTSEDFRSNYIRTTGSYFHPHNRKVELTLNERHFCDQTPNNDFIEIHNRKIAIENEVHDQIWFDFNELCGYQRSVRDYIEIANLYALVIVTDIPLFKNNDDNARRFIHLIDELYDRNVKIIISAAADIDELYCTGNLGKMFRRTQSRLKQMQSGEYLENQHRMI